MQDEPKSVRWLIAGGTFLLAVMVLAYLLRTSDSPNQELEAKIGKLRLVAAMRLNLTSSAEAEKSAVMAVTDADSITYADQARAAAGKVEEDRRELEALLARGPAEEQKLLAGFGQSFTELRKLDAVILDLAVKNTNLKAYDLAFGPAALAVKDMEAALARLVAANPEAAEVQKAAAAAQVGVLHVQALLAPHIAEETDARMDALETAMKAEEETVRRSLASLAQAPSLQDRSALDEAQTFRDRFAEIKTRILALSRENTNVRSLALSLEQKRALTLVCQDALNALQKAIEAEPIAGVTFAHPARPR